MQVFQEQPLMTMKATNGTVLVFDNRVVIQRKGLTAMATQGIKGDTTFFYNTLSGIEYKKPGLINGYLRFIVAGTQTYNPNAGMFNSKTNFFTSVNNATKNNMEDPNTVVLNAVNSKIPAQSEQIYNFILMKINESKSANSNNVNLGFPQPNNIPNNNAIDSQELLRMINELTLPQRAEIIVTMNKMIAQNRNSNH